jgi:hypothetical protein
MARSNHCSAEVSLTLERARKSSIKHRGCRLEGRTPEVQMERGRVVDDAR